MLYIDHMHLFRRSPIDRCIDAIDNRPVIFGDVILNVDYDQCNVSHDTSFTYHIIRLSFRNNQRTLEPSKNRDITETSSPIMHLFHDLRYRIAPALDLVGGNHVDTAALESAVARLVFKP